uniref:AMP_N domain-containing protein n=1 Tax=Haemonchus contortus TaxID=6289 RepID=A0A7I4XY58_HAECO
MFPIPEGGSCVERHQNLVRLLASASNVAAPPPRRQMVKLPSERFPAILETSEDGKHPTLRYSIPGQPLCYTFKREAVVWRSSLHPT